MADAKQIAVALFLDPTSGQMTADPTRIQQVAWNLVSNAIKFTSTGGRVEVRLTRQGSNVQLSVSDTG